MATATKCSCSTLLMNVVSISLHRVFLVKIVAKLTCAHRTVVLIRRIMDCPLNSVKVDAPRQQLQQLRRLLKNAKIIRFHCFGTRRLEMKSYGEFDFPAFRASDIITNCCPHIHSFIKLLLAQTLLRILKHGVALVQNRNFSTNLQKIAAKITMASLTYPWIRARWKIYALTPSR